MTRIFEFKSITQLEPKDPDVAKYRHPGGGPRKFITRGAKEGRLMWYKINVKHRGGAKLIDNLTQLEQAVEDIRHLKNEASYDDLYPVVSSFYLVEEAARLYYGDETDWRYKKGVKTPYTDVNNVGRSVSGVGRTLKRPFHGDFGKPCTCYICMPENEKD